MLRYRSIMLKGPHYVFIGDQGRVFSSFAEPTADDLGYAAVGMLTILSLRDLRTYGRECRWLPIEEKKQGARSLTNPFLQKVTKLTESQTRSPTLLFPSLPSVQIQSRSF